MLPGGLAVILALIANVIDVRALLILLSFAAACLVANCAASRPVSIAAHAIMLLICAGLFLHVMPGFDNPRVLNNVVLGSESTSYTKYLNFDKGMAGLLLLGLYAPDRPASDEGAQHVVVIICRFAIVVAIAMGLSLMVGHVRWDPKLPSWWALWTWSMVFLTALPEEAVFRGVAQTWIARRLGDRLRGAAVATVSAGLMFGLAHVVGGPVYVILASVAGVGYGWIYASTRSIGAAIVAHAGLNAIHLIFFTYPALTSVN